MDPTGVVVSQWDVGPFRSPYAMHDGFCFIVAGPKGVVVCLIYEEPLCSVWWDYLLLYVCFRSALQSALCTCRSGVCLQGAWCV